MVILGLTGSIGMGKSTVANMLRRLGVPVHDADAAVHRLTGRNGAAVPLIAKSFRGVVVDGRVDRRRLGDRVFRDPAALRRLEAILHPLVRRDSEAFLASQARLRRPLAVLDIPLLYETGSEQRCDAVLVVTAPPHVQAARVLARPGMDAKKFRAILAQQVPDAEKRRRAEFVLSTGLSRGETLRRLARIVRLVKGRIGRRWPPRPPLRHGRHA